MATDEFNITYVYCSLNKSIKYNLLNINRRLYLYMCVNAYVHH